MKKIFQCILLLILLSVILISNIRGLLQNYYGFYYPGEKEKLKTNKIYSSLTKIQNLHYYNMFTTYTGFETGYGFFAPNVASDFVLYFTSYNEKGEIIDSTNFVPVNCKESIIRITTAFNMFLNFNKTDSASLESQKCIIFLKGLCFKNLIKNNAAYKIKVDIYLYHFPLLSQIKSNNEPDPLLILFYTKTFSLKEYENWK